MNIDMQCELAVIYNGIKRELEESNDKEGGVLDVHSLALLLSDKVKVVTKLGFWQLLTRRVTSTLSFKWGNVSRSVSIKRKLGECEKDELARAQLIYAVLKETNMSPLRCLAMDLPYRKTRHLTCPNVQSINPVIVHVKPFKSTNTGLIHYRLTCMNENCNTYVSVVDGMDDVDAFVKHPTIKYVEREQFDG